MDCRAFLRRGFASLLAAGTLTLSIFVAASARAEEGSPGGNERKPFAGNMTPAKRHPLLEAWKAQRSLRPAAQRAGGGLEPLATGGSPIVGRASMVINTGGNVVYTQNWLGSANNCDVDLRNATAWHPSTAYTSGDHVTPVSGGQNFMAQNSGTSGSSEPSWNSTFGATTPGDGSITWVCTGTNWAAGRSYLAGMTVSTSFSSDDKPGFTYKAQNNGTSGGTEPFWPTTAGGTANDNGITWKAIGYFPGSFKGCNPMTMAIKASGGGDTVIATEGDLVGSAQLSGWGEFIAMNSAGKVVFRTALVDYLNNEDEAGSGIVLAGPGSGQESLVAKSGTTIGGAFICGFGTMVGMNSNNQVAFDGYQYVPGFAWQQSHSYGSSSRVMPTAPNGLEYDSNSGGTSGSTEPDWPTTLGSTVLDGTITWTTQVARYPSCDEDFHSIIRHSAGPGNELLVTLGSSIGGSTVEGFGTDTYNATISSRCTQTTNCTYENFDGFINSVGHVPVVLHLADGTLGVYNFSGPGTATEVARTGGVNPYTSLTPRVTINDSDQVVFGGNSGGLARIFRFTPPSTTVTVVSVGDDVGTRSVGVANGITFASFGDRFDMNNSGNIVFQAKLSGTQEGYYFWNGSTGQISEILRQTDVSGLAAEMITVNDSNLVAYVTGSTLDTYPTDESGGHETGGAFFWQAGVTQDAISVGDTVDGDTVTSVYAQHLSFARRQLSEAGCIAVAYHDQGDDPGFDCEEGGQINPCHAEGGGNANFAKGGQLFVSCASSCPAILLSPPTLPGGADGVPYNQTITASGGTAPYAFAVSGGSTGALNLSSAGVISGSPSGAGTLDFTVTATDHNGCTGSMDYSIVVGSSAQVNLTISPTALTTVAVGQTAGYIVTISQVQGTDTLITLSSSDTGVGTVPANVTITAGNTTASFNATGVAVGGPVVITASLPGSFEAPSATDYLQVVEPQVQVEIPMMDWKGFLVLALGLAVAGWLATRKLL